MKLLLDQNLSLRLARTLAAIYPDTTHVRDVGLQAADDDTVWAFASAHGFVIVSKDADFHQRSFVTRQADLLAFELDEHGAFLALG